ncbi:hypothetical protein [Antrihabitans spumae]|uniref:Amphi-Trp domain-containing protein n=1 Tax=Antrihabitans spumae TaxID=3373370 RepID=A0ABW7JZG1_9NOCA
MELNLHEQEEFDVSIDDAKTDDRPGLDRALTEAFEQVEISMTGDVALFTARGPRRRLGSPTQLSS